MSQPVPQPCSLCGLPSDRACVGHFPDGEELPFCCPGCRQVYLILASRPDIEGRKFCETDLFKKCQALGIIPGRDGDGPARPPSGEEMGFGATAGLPPVTSTTVDLSQVLTLQIGGMWCTACSWLIEEALKRRQGVLDVRVCFFTDRVDIRYFPHVVEQDELRRIIHGLGYLTSAGDESSPEENREKELFLRLGVSAILTANIMMLSVVLYSGFFVTLEPEIIDRFSWVLWALATPVVFYGGLPILQRALAALRHGGAVMETLIALGALASYGYSVRGVLCHSIHLYFDTAAMLVTLALLGKFIELRARHRVTQGLSELRQLAGGKVRLLQEGRTRWVASQAVHKGDLILVEAGEGVPLDGIVRGGEALTDASFLTGESRPLHHRAGDAVPAGERIIEGRLTLEVRHVGEKSTLGRMAALIREALSRKNRLELFADRITRRMIPTVVLLAVGGALVLAVAGLPVEEAFLRALTVLVITCPCALGIATPLAKVAAMEAGRSQGIMVHNPETLERAGSLDVLILDKTGTVTEGRFALRHDVTVGSVREEALRRAATLERCSGHLLGRTLVTQALEESLSLYASVEDAQEFSGLGITGRVDGLTTAVGNLRFLRELTWDIPEELLTSAKAAEAEGLTTVYVGWEGSGHAVFAFGDTLKEGTEETVRAMRKRGLTLWLLSGDATAVTEMTARKLEIDRFCGEKLPQDKVTIIRELQEQGHRVGMVGDGLNDAAALAQADVGFSLGTGAHLLEAASDVALLANHPAQVLPMMDLAALTTRIIRWNFFFAFTYNVLGIPLAFTGALNPILAVCAMFASSLTVIGSTLRILRNARPTDNREAPLSQSDVRSSPEAEK